MIKVVILKNFLNVLSAKKTNKSRFYGKKYQQILRLQMIENVLKFSKNKLFKLLFKIRNIN
jgi:hypothetical protein